MGGMAASRAAIPFFVPVADVATLMQRRQLKDQLIPPRSS